MRRRRGGPATISGGWRGRGIGAAFVAGI